MGSDRPAPPAPEVGARAQGLTPPLQRNDLLRGSEMRCEVIAIGTELLLGIIVDSNSAWIGEQLALAGIDSYFQVKVGDNFARIEACIRQGLERSDAVIR